MYKIGEVKVTRDNFNRVIDLHEDLAVRRQQLILKAKYERAGQICRIMIYLEDSIKEAIKQETSNEKLTLKEAMKDFLNRIKDQPYAKHEIFTEDKQSYCCYKPSEFLLNLIRKNS